MVQKTYWLLEVGDPEKPLYMAHFTDGIAFTKNIKHACKFALEKYAKYHLVNARAMMPGLGRLDDVRIVSRSVAVSSKPLSL